MVYLEKQFRNGKYYYYLTHSLRLKDNKFKKVRLYLKSFKNELSEKSKLVLENIDLFDEYVNTKFPELATDYDINIFFKDVDRLFLKSDLLNVEIVKKRFMKIKENLDYYNKLRENFVILHSYNSTKVEGNTFTKQDTHLLLTKGIINKTKQLREANEILNISKAMDFIEDYDGE